MSDFLEKERQFRKEYNALGSRPRELSASDNVNVWRSGEFLGVFAVKEFNWDLWCKYEKVAE